MIRPTFYLDQYAGADGDSERAKPGNRTGGLGKLVRVRRPEKDDEPFLLHPFRSSSHLHSGSPSFEPVPSK